MYVHVCVCGFEWENRLEIYFQSPVNASYLELDWGERGAEINVTNVKWDQYKYSIVCTKRRYHSKYTTIVCMQYEADLLPLRRLHLNFPFIFEVYCKIAQSSWFQIDFRLFFSLSPGLRLSFSLLAFYFVSCILLFPPLFCCCLTHAHSFTHVINIVNGVASSL